MSRLPLLAILASALGGAFPSASVRPASGNPRGQNSGGRHHKPRRAKRRKKGSR